MASSCDKVVFLLFLFNNKKKDAQRNVVKTSDKATLRELGRKYCTIFEPATVEVSKDEKAWALCDLDMTVQDITENLGMNYMRFLEASPEPEASDVPEVVLQSATSSSAFDLLMKPKLMIPAVKTSSAGVKGGLSNKDGIHNRLVEACHENNWKFRDNQEASYVLQTITNAGWYIAECIGQMRDAHDHDPRIKSVPDLMQGIISKMEKTKSKKARKQLSQQDLNSHAEALVKLLDKPVLQQSSLAPLRSMIRDFYESLLAYKEYLKAKSAVSASNRESLTPVRELGKNLDAEFRRKVVNPSVAMRQLDAKLKLTADWVPISMGDACEDMSKFQRYAFIANIILSCDIYVIKYCPGGNLKTIIYICKVPDNATEKDKNTHLARLIAELRPKLPVYYTAAMKREFKKKVRNIAKVAPGILDYVYADLTKDASAPRNREMRALIEIAASGEPDIVTDLRHLNSGRPGETFSVFWSKMEEVVNEKTAVDDRRHGVAHFSNWISDRDLVEQTREKCPPDTPIPSLALVRLQFTPKNKYTRRAAQYTGRFDVQRKIQVRQLRQSHPDAHYVAAMFRYMRVRASDLCEDMYFVFTDDKCKIPVGEPGSFISTVGRNRASPAPSQATPQALDHDMATKAKITPTVCLIPEVPMYPDQSWYQGQVTVRLFDTITSKSSAYLNAAILVNDCIEGGQRKPIMFKFSDGGSEHRNVLVKVQLSIIAIFKLLNLDFIAAGRTAPGQSWLNPVERCMSVLNIAIQNVATARSPCSVELEAKLKSCGSMNGVRQKLTSPELIAEWQESTKPVREMLGRRMQRVRLKEKPVLVREEITDDVVVDKLKDLFLGLDPHTVTKKNTPHEVVEFMRTHCRKRQYMFQIRKCDDISCCLPPRTPESSRQWIPDPQMGDEEHYKPLVDIIGQETDDSERPGAKPCEKKKKDEPVFMDEDRETQRNMKLIPLTKNFAQTTIDCAECEKPRIVYYRANYITQKTLGALRETRERDDYCCGSFPVPIDDPSQNDIAVNLSLTCGDPIEKLYYSPEKRLGRLDLCAYCGEPECEADSELLKEYKTVLPLCIPCGLKGKKSITRVGYGAAANPLAPPKPKKK